MLAHRDQENLVSRQAVRGLQPKTPGERFPKTPLKVPLNDENGAAGFGGKSGLRTKGNNENISTIGKSAKGLGKSNLATPLEPRTSRAPLGNKTTNAKARTTTAAGVKDIVREFEKTQTKPTATKRPKQAAPHAGPARLEIHPDKAGPLEAEEDIEYAPPRPKDIPYESDILPEGALTFESLKPENRLRGYYDYYINQVDENGMSRSDREMEEARQRSFQKLDEQVKRDMDELDWGIGCISRNKQLKRDTTATNSTGPSKPDSKAARTVPRHPPTLASRRAVSALSVVPKSVTNTRGTTEKVGPTKAKGVASLLPGRRVAPKPALTRESSAERATAVAASRTTLGYSKGRSASSAAHRADRPQTSGRTLARSVSTASSGSDATITPARFARGREDNEDTTKKLEFLSIFDADEEEDDGGIGGSVLPDDDDLEDEFKLDLGF